MPIYEYRCRVCGHTSEHLRAAERADEPVACACGHTDVARLPSLVARRASVAGGGDLPLAGGSEAAATAGAGACCGGGCCS